MEARFPERIINQRFFRDQRAEFTANSSRHSLLGIIRQGLAVVAALFVHSAFVNGHHPHDVVDAFAVSPNYTQDGTVFLASKGSINLFLASHDGGFTWESSRSGMRSSRIHQIVIDPNWCASGTAYLVGTAGLEKTTDRGRTWQRIAEHTGLQHIALARGVAEAAGVLFAASHHQLYRNDENGYHQLSGLPTGTAKILALAVSPAYREDSTVVMATEDSRLFVSHDAGNSWKAVSVSGSVRKITFSPQFSIDKTLWLATHGAGILRSKDGGETFHPMVAENIGPNVNDIVVAPGYPYPRHLMAATPAKGVFLSKNNGFSWQLMDLQVDENWQAQGNHYTSVSFSPSYPQDPTLFSGTFEGMYLSRDRGVTWEESSINPTRMGRRVAISPTYAEDHSLFAGGYGQGILISSDGGRSWRNTFQRYQEWGAYSMAPSPNYAQDSLFITGVGSGIRRTTDGGLTWKVIQLEHKAPSEPKEFRWGSPIYSVAYSPDFSSDRTIYAVCIKGDVFRSKDAGLTWKSIAQIPSAWTNRVGLSPNFAQDSTLFVGKKYLFRSVDGGDTFEQVLDQWMRDLFVAPDFEASGEVFCSMLTANGVMKSMDRGESWSTSGDGLDGYEPLSLSFSEDYANDGTLHVLTLGGGLFRSNDRGAHWKRAYPRGNPVDAAFSMAMSPNYNSDGTILLGTYNGFILSTDKGQTFRYITNSEFYDVSRPPWIKKGNDWNYRILDGSIGWGTALAEKRGQTLEFSFHGVGLRLYGFMGPRYGKVELKLDGKIIRTIDCYAETPEKQQIIAQIEGLESDTHTLEVRVLGDKNPAAEGTLVAIDAIEIIYRESSQAEVVW